MSKYNSVVILIVVFLVLSAVLFGLFQHYKLCAPINTDILGNYGDFVGGVLSVISIYLLVKTLRQQRDDSKEQQIFISDQNKNAQHQIRIIEENNFNSMFFGLLRHLQKEIEDLSIHKDNVQYTNKDYFETLRQDLQKQFQPQDKYAKNVSRAICDYIKLYVKNPRLASYF